MREVKINDNGEVLVVHCPMAFNTSCDDDHVLQPCMDSCAWFRIEEDDFRMVDGEPSKIKVDYRVAYCKDHCIGKIKESE